MATVTLVAGALTTSKNAGMAFRDWPNSDGQFMLTYPWFADFAKDWDKFLEHGHRLAGILIGIWAIGLVVLTALSRSRPSVLWLARAVLAGVILQGLLGGFRVQLDERGLALIHGAFAAVVLSLMGGVATLLSPKWADAGGELPGAFDREARNDRLSLARIAALLLPLLLMTQFLLGGMVRHHGRNLHEHLGLGILAAFAIIANAVIAGRTGERWMRSSARAVLALGLLQVSLGIGAWVTKFGFAAAGYVAVADSIVQVASRSAHTVIGILLVMTAVVHAFRVCHTCVLREVSGASTQQTMKATPLAALSTGSATR
ncbi:Heme A synthase [Caulifigura coniformis]|uniref:Heme A synthase n=1 Tax=Caulifigura coniformis TaxID=2527983 RepID=A0A517SKT3_9PLAN|nr:Heme A synthase [Caulifigura coniformis]